MKEIYLAGGCFWGTRKFFDQFDGIIEAEVGCRGFMRIAVNGMIG